MWERAKKYLAYFINGISTTIPAFLYDCTFVTKSCLQSDLYGAFSEGENTRKCDLKSPWENVLSKGAFQESSQIEMTVD